MELNYNPQHKAMFDELLLVIPGVKAGKAFGYPCYKINGKVFCFVGGAGAALKLPRQRVQELIAAGAAQPFEVADGIVWKDWVSIDHKDSQAYAADLPLLEEAVGYVGGIG